jgi:hypothetical protein
MRGVMMDTYSVSGVERNPCRVDIPPFNIRKKIR